MQQTPCSSKRLGTHYPDEMQKTPDSEYPVTPPTVKFFAHGDPVERRVKEATADLLDSSTEVAMARAGRVLLLEKNRCERIMRREGA